MNMNKMSYTAVVTYKSIETYIGLTENQFAEKYFIICKPQLCSLSSRNELANTCRHARKCCLTNI